MDQFENQRNPEVDIAFINAKTRLAITIACGGMLSLLVGLVVLLFGVANNDTAIFKFGSFEVSASGIGAVIMATSVAWAYLAYKVKPNYSASHRIIQKVTPDGSQEYHHSMDTTQPIPTDAINKALRNRNEVS